MIEKFSKPKEVNTPGKKVDIDRRIEPSKNRLNPKEVYPPNNKVDIDRRVEPRNNQRDVGNNKNIFDVRVKEFNTQLPSEKYFDWTGVRGDSVAIPKNEGLYNVLRDYGREGVEFKNGFADFTPFSEGSAVIDRITPNRNETFNKAYKEMANNWNKEKKDGRSDWTARDVKQWTKDENLTPHECEDGKTVQFVHREVHDNIPHTGGHSLAVNKEKSSTVKFDK